MPAQEQGLVLSHTEYFACYRYALEFARVDLHENP